jgi:hypothetical protein
VILLYIFIAFFLYFAAPRAFVRALTFTIVLVLAVACVAAIIVGLT